MAKGYANRVDWFHGTVDRFWSYVDRKGDDECWLWQGTKHLPNPCGMVYGSFGVTKSKGGPSMDYRAHRFSYVLANGVIPDGHLIMHTCDTPLCVNPAHLMAGTHLTNAQDREAKGRGTPGELNGRAKLTEQDVMDIRASKETTAVLAKRYDMDYTQILRVRRGDKWKHIPMPENDSVHERRNET